MSKLVFDVPEPSSACRDWTALLRLTATDFNYEKELYSLPRRAVRYRSQASLNPSNELTGVGSEKGKKV